MAEASVWQLHRDACDRGQHSYVDPDSGYLVFTRIGLLAREKCRGAGCRHCPYAHENVELPARTVKMHQAAWLSETRPPGDRDTGVLCWSGGKDSFLAYRATERDGDLALVLLTTFDAATGFIAHQDLHIDTVVEQARRLGRLLDDSIGENIRLAKPSATQEEVIAAAVAANCHDFIEALPNGYDTGVGEIGGALSGGERQRISIARAILKDAPIVILDEPTSALDTESEVAVQRAIDTLVKDKTVLVIAHRLSTIVAADNIIVLESREIVEQGDHHALLTQEGCYAEMWNAQRADRHWRITSEQVTT